MFERKGFKRIKEPLWLNKLDTKIILLQKKFLTFLLFLCLMMAMIKGNNKS